MGEAAYEKENVFVNLQPGDHLAVGNPGTASWHHGIYIGKRETRPYVIHLYPEKTIACDTLATFAKPYSHAAIIESSDSSRDASAQRAIDAFKEHRIQCDAQTFAIFCRTGRWDHNANTLSFYVCSNSSSTPHTIPRKRFSLA